MTAAGPTRAPGLRLRWVGLVGLVAIATMKVAVVIAPHVLFDVDPARFPGAFGGLSAAGGIWLDVLLLLACAVAISGEAIAGRGIDWRPFALAAAPIPIVLWHGSPELGDLWRGAAWAAGLVAAVTVAHLARDPMMRRVLLAVLLAALAPLLARGALQVTIEHQDTIAAFEANREAFLREKGWTPDSPAARIYERRLRQPQPRGWFVTSNVFGSAMIVGLLGWIGLAVAARHARLSGGWIGLPVVFALGTAAALWLTGSKGAILAAMAGAVVLAAGLAWSNGRRLAALLPVALPIAALGGIALRGAVLPESFLGDLSLLFRWHYVTAACRIVAEAPWFGVGPDGFQEAYVLVRDARSPEEVTSTHSMLFDWLAMLGVATVAWIGLLFWMLFGAGRERAEGGAPAGIGAPAVIAAIAIALIGLVPAIAIEAPTLDPLLLAVRVMGVLGFLFFALVALHIVRDATGTAIQWTSAAAVTGLIVHGQIEMTFFPPGAVTWALCWVGLAGPGVPRDRPGESPRAGLAIGAAVVLLAAWLAVTGAVPATGQQRLMRRAAAVLRPLATATEVPPGVEPRLRRESADLLVAAWQRCPTDSFPLEAAASQLALAAMASEGEPRKLLLTDARATIGEAVSAHGRGRAVALAAAIERQAAELSGSEVDWNSAIAFARRLAEMDPRAIGSWRALGNTAWAAGRREEAAAAYRRALEADANFELDPMKQLAEGERRRIKSRIEQVGEGGS